RWKMASSAPDDALMLRYRANPRPDGIFGNNNRQPRRIAVAVAYLQPAVAAVDPADVAQPGADRCFVGLHDSLARDPEQPDDRHFRLLRIPRQGPRAHRAAKQRDELAALHSITSSARRRNDSEPG